MEKDNREMDLLIVKCIQGDATEEECSKVWNWIREHEQNRKHYEQFRDIWIASVLDHSVDEKTTREIWEHIKNKANLANKSDRRPSLGRIGWKVAQIAAMIAIVFVLGVLYGSKFSKKVADQGKPAQNIFTVEAPRGAKSFVKLADGTRVWLNAGSKISYSLLYNQKNRDIFLIGEAFFEVAKNKEIPFYVHSSGIVVKALGTAFNVKAYPEEGIVETTLVEGKITIESTNKSGQKEQITMLPNQKANFYKVTNKVELVEEPQTELMPGTVKPKIVRIEVKKEIDPLIYTSWKDKRWVFEKQNLQDFAVIMERIYDVKVRFKDESLKNFKLSGSLEEENLEQVLQAIQFTIPIDYEINHHEVILSINKNLKNRYQRILKNNDYLTN